jgi:drug/metabolite transporter (DMT)-like permease
MSSTGLHIKTYVFLSLMILFGPLGDVLLKKGMAGIGAVNNWSPLALAHLFFQVFTSGMIWLGILSLLGFFTAYILVLSWADYSYVQPASSIAYAVVALMGYLLLHEAITPMRWAGVLLISFGVFVVGRTPPRTTTEHLEPRSTCEPLR